MGGKSEGTLKPGAPMVNGSNDSADDSESVMNFDSSELKRDDASGAADALADVEGSENPVLLV